MVTILLAAYNGEKYIAEQIESILNQTYGNWKLIVQDDCSSDSTCEIVGKYVSRYPGRITLKRRTVPSGSAKDNFFSMLQYAGSEYTMTCDQDDVWLPDKIEITLDKMNKMEAEFGRSTPILVHTDLKVTDENLNVLSDSLVRYQKLDVNRVRLNNLLVQNVVTGCTMMINRALINKLKVAPANVIMHDWWIALAASAFGQIGYVDKPTVLYRQHEGNSVGAKDVNNILYRIGRVLNLNHIKQMLAATYDQAEAFLHSYEEQLSKESKETINAYLKIPNLNRIEKIKYISRYDFWKSGFFRRCGQIVIQP